MANKDKNHNPKHAVEITVLHKRPKPIIDFSRITSMRSARGLANMLRWEYAARARYLRIFAAPDGHVKARSRNGWPTGGKRARAVEAAKRQQEADKLRAATKQANINSAELYHKWLGELEHSRELLGQFKSLRREYEGVVHTADNAGMPRPTWTDWLERHDWLERQQTA